MQRHTSAAQPTCWHPPVPQTALCAACHQDGEKRPPAAGHSRATRHWDMKQHSQCEPSCCTAHHRAKQQRPCSKRCSPHHRTCASRSCPLLPMPTTLMGEGRASVQPCSSNDGAGRVGRWRQRQRRRLGGKPLQQLRTWKSAEVAAANLLVILRSRFVPAGTQSADGRGAAPRQAGCGCIGDSTVLAARP